MVEAKKNMGRKQMGHQEMVSMARLISNCLDAIVVVDVDPEVSLSRGSRMTEKFLNSLYSVHNDLSTLLGQGIFGHYSDAIPIINISGTESYDNVRDFTTRSLGTVISAQYNIRTAWNDILEKLGY